MAGNDIFLYSVPSDADQDDIRLRDPTVASGTGPTDYPLTATSSAIVISGSSVILAFGRVILASTSAIALAASNVSLRKGYSLGATSSAITLSGSSVALQFGRKISATSSAIVLTPSNVTLAFGHKINATSSTVVLASPNVTLATGRKVNATSSAIVLSGSNVTLTYAPAVGTYEIIATSSAIVLAPSTVALAYAPSSQISGGGSYTWAKNRLFKRPDEEEQPEKIPLEVVKIGKADSQIITGLVVPKAKPKQTRPAVLEKLAASEFNAAKLRGEQLKRLQMADDEWLMTA
jgi:hypothetical protein